MSAHRRVQNEIQSRFRTALQNLPGSSPDVELSQATALVVLPEGYQDRNLYAPSEGATPPAVPFFERRGIAWWHSDAFNEAPGHPTRHLVSSQVACVNALLAPAEYPEILAAMVRDTIDPSLERLEPMRYAADYLDGHEIDSMIELEWAELGTTLEGTRISRGKHATSADALLVGVTTTGRRRAYIFEWKYTEVAGRQDRGVGDSGDTRKRRYAVHYAESPTLNSSLPLEVALIEPAYQYMRLAMLGDLMVDRGRFGVDDFYIVSVCPNANVAYLAPRSHPFLTHPAVACQTLHEGLRRLFREPARLRFTEPAELIRAARNAQAPAELQPWLKYMADRYGW